jgi:hypothetical protein
MYRTNPMNKLFVNQISEIKSQSQHYNQTPQSYIQNN